MNVFFIGCLHFGHEWMAKYRNFQDSFYHDEHMITQWNMNVGRKDLVYILGDVTMENSDHYYQLDRLNGRKKVVLGNHDLSKHVPELLKYVDEVAGMVDYKGFILSHPPIHPSEISFCRGNIHAHIHHVNKLYDCSVYDRYDDSRLGLRYPTNHKYINVDAKLLDFQPLSLDNAIKLVSNV